MANTTTISMPFITVLFDGATNWDLQTEFAKYPHIVSNGVRIISITMIPNAAGDAVVVRNALSSNKTSAKIFQAIAISPFDQPQRLNFTHGQYSFPSIHADEVDTGVQLLFEVRA